MESGLLLEIEKQLLERLLRSLYYCIGLPISALDERGITVCSFGDINPFCSAFKSMISKNTEPKDPCKDLHRRAALRCMRVDGTFIFTCHASLNHIIFPLRNDAKCCGSILIGPFLVQPFRDEQLAEISVNYALRPADLLRLEHSAGSIPVISAEKAGQISSLLGYVFEPVLSKRAVNGKDTEDNGQECSVSKRAIQEFIAKTRKNSNKIVQKAALYITENYDKAITLKDISDHLGMNPSYISTLFKQSYQVSYREFFNMVRIEAAKALLCRTTDSILDISVSTGFKDQSYFTKVFKRYTGMTPKQYRAESA